MPRSYKIGILGLGKMGKCLMEGLSKQQAMFKTNPLWFSTRRPSPGSKSNQELVENCDVIILAVKPQNAAEVLKEVGPHLGENKTLISIVASIGTSEIEKAVAKGTAVIRAMPNTPALVGEGITALCAGGSAEKRHLDIAQEIFEAVGKVVLVDEKQMDAVTGLSGCGPAYLYVVLESLTDAGIKVGLPRETAVQLASQTVLGAAKMLQVTQKHPAALKDEVTTPAGCTIDGLLELEEGRLRVTLIKAVVKATERAKALAKKENV